MSDYYLLLEYFWIGLLNDLKENDNYVWDATGGAISGGYQNWQPGEPTHSAGGRFENCIHIGQGKQPGWNDVNCELTHASSSLDIPLGGICELQP